jgi:hypothetical protein
VATITRTTSTPNHQDVDRDHDHGDPLDHDGHIEDHGDEQHQRHDDRANDQ